VTGKASGRDEYGVAPKGQPRRPRVPRQPDPRGAPDPPLFRHADRDRGDFNVGARLDLDKGDRTAPSCNQVDFTAGDDVAPREDPEPCSIRPWLSKRVQACKVYPYVSICYRPCAFERVRG
jgi:hypothetical protein